MTLSFGGLALVLNCFLARISHACCRGSSPSAECLSQVLHVYMVCIYMPTLTPETTPIYVDTLFMECLSTPTLTNYLIPVLPCNRLTLSHTMSFSIKHTQGLT